MRTFIAVPLPVQIRRVLEELQGKLRASDADVRWPSAASIHLTLKFLGEVQPGSVPEIARRLEAAIADDHPFELRLSGLGTFPNIRDPRIVWCGIKGETERLASLHEKVERTCAEHGFPPEDRRFRPHLTLGRVRSRRNLHRLKDCIKMGAELEQGFVVSALHIYKSTLTPRGAVYEVLHTISLRNVEAS